MEASDAHLATVVKGVNDFTLDLYLATSKMKGAGQNVLVSPLSASLVTAMVHAGAQGKTASELEDRLRLPKDKDVRENGFKALHDILANTQNVTLEIANRIYLEKTSELKTDYKDTVSNVHKSDVEQADFIQNAEKERGTINGWVSDKTHKKINDLLPPGILNSDTRLVLINAIYFYGKWKLPFDRQQTQDEDFYISKTKTKKVPMMHLTKNLHYAEIPELDAKAVELCYTNEKVCLQIILPNSKDGLESMQEKLRSGAFDLANIQFYSTKVQLSMPKFKLEETMDLKQIYMAMGITTMFTPEADLSGMVKLKPNESLMVSDAVQKTFMDVNEEGTEAAAATACVSRRKRCIVEEPLEICVDHPFLFRLVNAASVMFIGSHYEPTVSGEDDAEADDDVEQRFSDKPQLKDATRPHKPSHCEL